MRFLGLLVLSTGFLCAQSQQVNAALAAGTYFPLDVGDRWVYRTDSRLTTAAYQIWRVGRTEERDGKTYTVMTIASNNFTYESHFRTGENGRIFVLTEAGEQLFLDPALSGTASGQLRILARGPSTASIGSFPDTLSYSNQVNLLTLEKGVLARGIGLLSSTSTLQTGSSGGFTEGRTLIEAVIGGKLRFSLASPGIQLGVENLTPNLTAKQSDNCTLPCYFAACYFGPFADPPDTYKPCTRARIALTSWPAGAARSVRLRLLAPDMSTVYDQAITLDTSAPEASAFTQIPLYSAPNQPFPPGAYQLNAATLDGSAQSTLTLQIR